MANDRARLVAGRYELREQLSLSDGHAVWLAHDHQTGRTVAVKRLLAERLADSRARRRLQAEADAVGRLDHRNIVPLLDAHVTPDEAALVFPLIDGHTLARRLADGPRLSALDTARLGAALAAALAHAHDAGVAHRDVKPANILLASDGQPRLLDFGIAATPDADPSAAHASSPTVVGTLPYMAPEHLAGAPAHPASDVYSLSVVLYEMLAGQRPYQAISPPTLADEQRRPPAPIPGAPPELMALIMSGLDPDPTARPSAAALGSRLAAWSTRLPDATTVPMAAARPAGATLGTATSARAGRGPDAVLVAAMVLLLAAAVTGSFLLGFGSGPGAVPLPSASAPEAGLETRLPTVTEGPVVTVNDPGSEPGSEPAKAKPGKRDRDKDKAKGKGKGRGDSRDEDDDEDEEDDGDDD